MARIYFVFFIIITLYQLTTAQNISYQIEFKEGQTAISLAQVDSISAFAQRAKALEHSRVRVVAYAHDAKEGDTNEQLSRRRAYLIQQCLERAGVPLSKLDIQSIVCDATVEICLAYANLSLEQGEKHTHRNSYLQRNQEFLFQQTSEEGESFWIDPTQENYWTSKEGILVYIPAHTFVTTQNTPIQMRLKVLEKSRQHWWNGLATTTAQKRLLVHQAIWLQAFQEGILLANELRLPITIILPSKEQQPEGWELWQKKQRWMQASERSTTALFLGNYYNKEHSPCKQSIDTIVKIPNYGIAPKRPEYINLKEVTALQDAAIAGLEERLKPLEAARYSKNGKKEIWTKEQRQRAFQLNNQKSQLLVIREKNQREAQNKNLQLEEGYYTALAMYNKKRHQLQMNYVQALEQQAHQDRLKGKNTQLSLQKEPCLVFEHYEQHLKTTYNATTYQQIKQRLTQLQHLVGTPQFGYWVRSEALGWMALAVNQEQQQTSRRFYAQSSISPYKTTAYYHQKDGQVFSGQPQEDGRLAFVGIDAFQEGVLLAIAEKEGEFVVAVQPIGGNAVSLEDKTIGLQFKFHNLQEALNTLTQ